MGEVAIITVNTHLMLGNCLAVIVLLCAWYIREGNLVAMAMEYG